MSVIGQLATLIQHPLAAVFTDTKSYTLAAQQISMSSAGLVETFRTPGYPLMLAAAFRLIGGVDYAAASQCVQIPITPYCASTFRIIVMVQAIIALSTILGCYVLAYRLAHSRWIACVVASLLAVNLFILSWERAILSEFLSFASLVAVFLCFERFVRRPRLSLALLLGLLMFASVMVRPFNIYLPGLLLGVIVLRALWIHDIQRYWKSVVLSGMVCGVCLLGYMTLNAQLNDFFGLTFDHNITLLGKVIEYRMQDMPVDPKYRGVQADLQTYLRAGNRDPWTFSTHFPGKHYSANGYGLPGAYAQSVITHSPIVFVRRSMSDLFDTWLLNSRFYPPYGLNPNGSLPPGGSIKLIPGVTAYWQVAGMVSAANEQVWVTALLNVSTLEQAAYLVLPILLVLLAYRLWRRPKDMDAFLLLSILLTVVFAIVLAAVGNYDEFYRVRYPMDWGMIAVCAIILLELLYKIRTRATRTRVDAPTSAAMHQEVAAETQTMREEFIV